MYFFVVQTLQYYGNIALTDNKFGIIYEALTAAAGIKTELGRF